MLWCSCGCIDYYGLFGFEICGLWVKFVLLCYLCGIDVVVVCYGGYCFVFVGLLGYVV